jgi:thymidine kinase
VAKLHFYYSAMNAGKSTTLLQSSHNYQERGMDTVVFAPALTADANDSSTTFISSRIGLRCQAVAFDGETDFVNYIETQLHQKSNIYCVLIDEAQFLTKSQVWQLCQLVDDYDMPVLAYGIRSDFQGEPFEGSLYLLTWADLLIEIKTICHCGRKAIMNLRVNGDGAAVVEGRQIEIGGNERYVAMCRQHFVRAIKHAWPANN